MPSTKERKPAAAALRSECLDSVGLCISVPAAWQRLGDTFGGLGFVAAEPRPGADPATWPHLTVAAITVAAIDAPAKEGGNAATQPQQANNGLPGDPVASATSSLDALVERMLIPDGTLASAHVLERSSLLLNGANAQIVRVGLPEEPGSAEAMETIALIEGEEGVVYSIALRCSPPDYNRLEPVFRQALQSWHLQSAEAAPSSTPPESATAPGRSRPKASHSNVTQSHATQSNATQPDATQSKPDPAVPSR